jgi:hypothetical protein
MKGYWLDSKTCRYWEIVEHYIAIESDAGRFGLSQEAQDQIAEIVRMGLPRNRKRKRLLLIAMDEGLIRVRQHKDFVTFEHRIEDERAVRAIHTFLEDSGLHRCQDKMRISNLLARASRSLTWSELDEEACVCPNCRHSLWMVGIGLGFRCGRLKGVGDDVPLGDQCPMLPSLTHTCDFYEMKRRAEECG